MWGFTQLPVDEETSKLLALVTRRGIMLPRCLYFGPKQGPGIFQSFVDTVFRGIRGESGEEFLSIFVDDCNISTANRTGEKEDDCFERHLCHLEQFMSTAQKRRVQFKLEKAKFAWEKIPILGFEAGRGTRTVTPGKAQALRDWEPPKNKEDVISFRAFANFLREFIPSFLLHDQRLKEMTKKGANFDLWWEKKENRDAFDAVRKSLEKTIEFSL